MRVFAALLLAAAGTGRVLAQDEDLSALDVADKAQASIDQRSHEWHALLEAAYDEVSYREGALGEQAGPDVERLSFDLHYDHLFAPRLRIVLADRLDADREEAPYGIMEVNTLKEAYLSWQESPQTLLDLGRINVRNGVAMGYNPTDYFRFDAVREVVSVDPVSLHENRLGSVMLRAQQLWTGGSVTALISPRLENEPSNAPFSADLGATNGSNRCLLALSEHLGRDFDPQLLLLGSEHQPVQAGLNLTHLLSSDTVAYLEYAGGRSATLAQQGSGASGPTSLISRVATGLTYTAPNNLSLTAEYDRNGAAPDRAEWAALQRSGAQVFDQTAQLIAQSQDLPDRQALFLLARWTDSLVRHLDLSGFVRMDMSDGSRLNWAEARYHWAHLDLALQWQLDSGALGTIYGETPPRQLWQLLVDGYLP
jgi:hypothetical protein